MIGRFVQIYDEADPLRSDTTLLVSSLLALGIPKHGRDLFAVTFEHIRGERQTRVTWTLKAESADGRFATCEMEKKWSDGAWLLQNPKHPLAILRGGLTYQRAFHLTPKFTREELARIETPDTWLEAAAINLIVLLRAIPQADPEGIVRFRTDRAAFIPTRLAEDRKTRLLKYVENPSKRAAMRKAA